MHLRATQVVWLQFAEEQQHNLGGDPGQEPKDSSSQV